jgi:zinc/manganese transport system permease protein
VVYAALLAWLMVRRASNGRIAFYVVFAIAVTISVQLVGLYLVFTTLIVPALATRRFTRGRIAAGAAVSVAGYLLGLIASAYTDLPTGPAIVWTMVAVAIPVFVLGPRPSPAVL